MNAEQTRQKLKHNLLFQKCQPFIVGGTSGCLAIICIQPIDIVKVRIQLYGEGTRSSSRPSPLSVAKDIVSKGGFLDLYSGLSAGLLRQLVYGTSRLGLFFTFEDLLKRRAQANDTTYGFTQRTAASLTAGGLGAFIGNPVEVALIRMQSDGLKPKVEQARYRSVFDALARIIRNEGVRTLWTGSYPTIVRAMSTNFGQLTFFSETKHQLQTRTDLSDKTQSLIASSVGGFFAAFFSLPFDLVKTRLQRQSKGGAGQMRYSGVADCFIKIAREEGLLRFYRGFGTYFLRIAPYR